MSENESQTTEAQPSQAASESLTSSAPSVSYVALPFYIAPERGHILNKILEELLKFESIFTDYVKDDQTKRSVMIHRLTRLDSAVWEVWRTENSLPVDVVGILYLTDVHWGQDAVAHYVFFDSDLRGKTALINELIDWCFEDHPERNWKALNRITVKVPVTFYALAKHAQRYLGFDGTFPYKIGNRTLEVEGVLREAMLWRGKPRDVLILGQLKDARRRNPTERHQDTGTETANSGLRRRNKSSAPEPVRTS